MTKEAFPFHYFRLHWWLLYFWELLLNFLRMKGNRLWIVGEHFSNYIENTNWGECVWHLSKKNYSHFYCSSGDEKRIQISQFWISEMNNINSSQPILLIHYSYQFLCIQCLKILFWTIIRINFTEWVEIELMPFNVSGKIKKLYFSEIS